MDMAAATRLCDQTWDASIIPELVEYIRIPNQSPAFDPDWQAAGHMDKAVDQVAAWCRAQPVAGLQVEVVRLPGRTPLLWMEVPGTIDDTVLLYGHLDKQPPMTGWDDDLGPWTPVLRDGKLYGRGGADDGYAAYASLTALRAVQEQGLDHARCVFLIECDEESGSEDLPAYVEHLLPRIGRPSLVVCLDSGCGNYEQLWCTTSLRGMVVATLDVAVLSEGVHSGDASGIVPDSFRVARRLLDRLEDPETGALLLDELFVEVPARRQAQAQVAAAELGPALEGKYPFLPGVRPASPPGAETVLARTWRPALTVTGQAGLPEVGRAGNVLRPHTSLKLSLRLPPTADSARAARALERALLSDPPHGARVTLSTSDHCDGWDSPPLADWLEAALERASQAVFGKPVCFMGEGGTIPFMGMLGERFPESQFVITGVLGPGSNAHGPNEFLELGTARRLTACVASLLADHARR